LYKYPAITVTNEGGEDVMVQVVHDSAMQATVSWNGLMSGRVVAN
jgi:hypothetical protein